jgi:hypothetical protein
MPSCAYTGCATTSVIGEGGLSDKPRLGRACVLRPLVLTARDLKLYA